jgi:hypothetical protein
LNSGAFCFILTSMLPGREYWLSSGQKHHILPANADEIEKTCLSSRQLNGEFSKLTLTGMYVDLSFMCFHNIITDR